MAPGLLGAVVFFLINAASSIATKPILRGGRHGNSRRHHHAPASNFDPGTVWGMLRAPDLGVPSLDDIQKEFEEVTEVAKRPLMSHINIMRVEMCWQRPNLMTHFKCLKFLGLKCGNGTTHLGICGKFTKEVTEACESDLDCAHTYSEEDCDELHTVQCRVAKQLNPRVLLPKEDADGDVVINIDDKFPRDSTEWLDSDGDGIGDNGDEDRDGDGHLNEDDTFPDNRTEWSDLDGDGIGDNADKDRDGDGHLNDEDAFPDDPTEWSDLDDDGIGDKVDVDRDGDGHLNHKDAFQHDPSEWSDLDNDQIGDNIDDDIDGDGVHNVHDSHPRDPTRADPVDSDGDGVPDLKDVFPEDPNEWQDSDGDDYGDNADAFPENREEWLDSDGDGHGDNVNDAFPEDPTEWKDSDGDGIGDNADVFPIDPNEWQDSDGDGIGDNADEFPNDPNCHKAPCAESEASAGHGKRAESEASAGHGKRAESEASAGHGKPWHLNKLRQGLPEQGYNEHSDDLSDHDDMNTYTSDWGHERPKHMKSEQNTLRRICVRHPNNLWCKRYSKHGRFAR